MSAGFAIGFGIIPGAALAIAMAREARRRLVRLRSLRTAKRGPKASPNTHRPNQVREQSNSNVAPVDR